MFNQGNSAVPKSSKVQATFFGKVIFFFALALLTSTAGVFVSGQYFMDYFLAYPALMFGAFAVELILVFTARMWSTRRPLNRLLFLLFAFLSGATAAPLIFSVAALPGGVPILAKALLATGLMFTATALFGWTTKINLSGLGGFLWVTLIGLIIVQVIGIFLPWGNAMEMVVSSIGVTLFSAFTAYDFQKFRNYPEDRYIDAALNLYLDIFNLFLYILRLMLAFSSRD